MPKKPLDIVCCFIFDGSDRILLLQRHTDDFGGGLWATPGGKQEPDEDTLMTARRETREETGIDVANLDFLGIHEIRMPHGTARVHAFRASVGDGAAVVLDPEEHEAYRWFDMDGLPQAENIIWGLPTQLLDFGFITPFGTDPTLADGSTVTLVELGGA